MKMEVETTINPENETMTTRITYNSFDAMLNSKLPFEIYERAVKEITERVVAKFIEDNFSAILEKISPGAIATMAVAQAGAEISTKIFQRNK